MNTFFWDREKNVRAFASLGDSRGPAGLKPQHDVCRAESTASILQAFNQKPKAPGRGQSAGLGLAGAESREGFPGCMTCSFVAAL